MAAQGRKILVLFEDGKPEIERQARAISERLLEQGRDVALSSASGVSVSDLLAADSYLLGADAPASSAYAELARIFRGLNLAGRKAAFFGSSGATVAWLRGICADTEITVAHADLVGRPDQTALAAWLKGVSSNS